MSKEDEILDRLRKLQMGDYLDMDEVEELEDNKQYLRAARTFYYGLLNEAKNLIMNPSPERIDEKIEYFKKKHEELEEKKKEKGFECDEFFEFWEVEDESKIILLMLFSKKGVGVSTANSTASGEQIIMALRLLTGEDVEDCRKRLTRSGELLGFDLIKEVFERERPYLPKHLRERRRRRERTSPEKMRYELSDWVIDGLYGEKQERTEHKGNGEKEEYEFLKKVDSDVELSQVVLPTDLKESILSLSEQQKNSEKFFDEWNLKSVIGERKGLNLLFSGFPGTGKTMLAKALANELDKELYQVSFGDMVDCYFGNTEKNASKLFDALNEDCILLIDEADAVLQRRSPSVSSCDRSENRVINIILQGMENHDGVIIFTTNIAIGLDRAIERRLDLKLEMPLPDAEAREKIWEYHIPEETPLCEDVCIGTLAEKYEFSGGHIRNSVLNAARKAMRKGRDHVEMEDFEEACEEELKGSKVMHSYLGILEEEPEDVRGYA